VHILLTDRLTCPRCGPEFGLILLADRIEERRVLDGTLGCPNCRDGFPVADGFGDLRAPPRSELPTPAEDPVPEEPDPEAVVRLAALLGVPRGPGHLALVGPAARWSGPIADLVEDIEVVGVDPGLRAQRERRGVSRLVAAPGLPFFSRTLRGVAVSGEGAEAWLTEAVRVVAPGGRVVVLDAPGGTRERLEDEGLRVVLAEEDVVVAHR
jgi:uncharacterized protein YbaR (Trm112 family)